MASKCICTIVGIYYAPINVLPHYFEHRQKWGVGRFVLPNPRLSLTTMKLQLVL